MTLPADMIKFFTAADTSGDGTPSISPMTVDSDTQTASYKLTATGDILTDEDDVGYTDVGDWLAPKVGMANFRVRATLMVGSVSAGSSALNTWLALSSDRLWKRIAGEFGGSTQLWIEIGPSGGAVVTSALITLNVTGTGISEGGEGGGGEGPPGGGGDTHIP